MANHVIVTICGEDYTFVADESESYMQKVGAYVGDKMDEILNSTRVGRADAAVLTAANIADELFKAQASAEQLRRQIKGYLDEAGNAKSFACSSASTAGAATINDPRTPRPRRLSRRASGRPRSRR